MYVLLLSKYYGHVIRTYQEFGICAIESPKPGDSPMTALCYVHQTLFFPAPNKRKERVWLRETSSSRNFLGTRNY